MAAAEGYLVDTSAYIRIDRGPDVARKWESQIDSGLIAVCGITELEIFRMSRSTRDYQNLKAKLRQSYGWVTVTDRALDRAREVQEEMVRRGTHRSAGPVDLIVAATAEAHQRTILHDDRDFECIAAVTGQPVQRVAA